MSNSRGVGHSYGEIHAEGQTHLHLGDVVSIKNVYELPRNEVGESKATAAGSSTFTRPSLPSSGTLNQATDVLDFLRYENMHAKRDFSMPEKAFNHEWIWSTPFEEWLHRSNDTFWVCGKPGSGKSTLMAYLAYSRRTRDRLLEQDKTFRVLYFFYDYRAGAALANTVEGMLRSFLYQLADEFPEIRTRLQDLMLTGEIDLTMTNLFSRTCEALNHSGTRICAFIDGLDEYEGSPVELMQVCRQLIDRTGVKLCVASRPDVPVSAFLKTFHEIFMQDHNRSSMEKYMGEKILEATVSNLDFEKRFTTSMREELIVKAEGIILWFKLACDETIKFYAAGFSDDQVREFVDKLPPGLEPIYERILSLIISSHRSEAAMILYLVAEFRNTMRANDDYYFERLFFSHIHVTDLDHLWATYEFLYEKYGDLLDLPKCNDHFEFQARVKSLLRGLVEVHEIKQVRADLFLGMTGLDVRYIHRTFDSFISRAKFIPDNLHPPFTNLFPDSFFLRLASAIIQEAASDALFSDTQIDRLCREYRLLLPSFYRLPIQGPLKTLRALSIALSRGGLFSTGVAMELFPRLLTWPHYNAGMFHKGIGKSFMRLNRPFEMSSKWLLKRELFRDSMLLLMRSAVQYEKNYASSLPIIGCALQSKLAPILAFFACESPFSNYLDNELLRSASAEDEIRSILDLLMAVSAGLVHYLQQRLKQATLNNRQITIINDAIMHQLHVYGWRDRTSIETNELLQCIIPQRGGFQGQHMCRFLLLAWQHKQGMQLAQTMVRLLRGSDAEIDLFNHWRRCQRSPRKGNLLLDWATLPRGESFMQHPWEDDHPYNMKLQALLPLLVQVGVDLSQPCYPGGSVLHALFDPKIHTQRLDSIVVKWKFVALIDCGLLPVRGEPLERVLQAAKSCDSYHWRQEHREFIIDHLKYYQTHQQWPNRTSNSIPARPPDDADATQTLGTNN